MQMVLEFSSPYDISSAKNKLVHLKNGLDGFFKVVIFDSSPSLKAGITLDNSTASKVDVHPEKTSKFFASTGKGDSIFFYAHNFMSDKEIELSAITSIIDNYKINDIKPSLESMSDIKLNKWLSTFNLPPLTEHEIKFQRERDHNPGDTTKAVIVSDIQAMLRLSRFSYNQIEKGKKAELLVNTKATLKERQPVNHDIDDFGEHIPFAKKELYAAKYLLEHYHIVNKENIWKKPNPVELIEGLGMEAAAAYLVNNLYNSLTKSPNLKNKASALACFGDEDHNDGNLGVLTMLKHECAKVKTTDDYFMVFDKVASERGWRCNSGFGMLNTKAQVEINTIGGRKLANALFRSSRLINKAKKEIEKGFPVKKPFWKVGYKYEFLNDTRIMVKKENGRGIVREFFNESEADKYLTKLAYKKALTTNEDKHDPNAFAIYRKLTKGSSLRYLQGGFDNIDAAHDFINENWLELYNAKPISLYTLKSKASIEKSKNLMANQHENTFRKGELPEYLKNPDEKVLFETFRIKGFQFGNSVPDTERAEAINLHAAALHDLSVVLKVPHEAMGLGNRLGLAYAARGAGKALAHYERTQTTINMTRRNGSGSFAHEYGHSLDHLMGASSDNDPHSMNYSTNRLGQLKRFDNDLGDALIALKDALLRRPGNKVELMQHIESKNPFTVTKLNSVVANLTKKASAQVSGLYLKSKNLSAGESEKVSNVDSFIEVLRDARESIQEGSFSNASTVHLTNKSVEAIADGYEKLFKVPMPTLLQETFALCADGYSRMFDKLKEYIDQPDTAPLVQTNFLKGAILYDEGRAKPYWSSGVELFARSFEAFVHDKLENKSQYNDYLVAGVNSPAYPSKKDMEYIKPRFDNFIKEYSRCVLDNKIPALGRHIELDDMPKLNVVNPIKQSKPLRMK